MGSGRARRAARMLAATGAAAALLGAAPGTAQAATEYDGDATALRIEGLQLELFPNGTEALPPRLTKAIKDLQAQAPEQLRRDSLTIAVPDQVVGHVEFPGTDIAGEIPDNPLLTARMLSARSVETSNGELVSEASVQGLSLAAGVLSADVIKTRCTGNGEQVSLDISQLELSSTQDIVENEVSLEPGTTVPIEGLGSLAFNTQETDGRTFAEGTNLVMQLDTDLSLDALARVLDTTAPATERVLKHVLSDVSTAKFPDGSQHLAPMREHLDAMSGKQVYDGIDTALDEINNQAPEELKGALNNVAHLGGTITLANAACSQATVTEAAPQPQEPQQAVPAEPVSDTSEPPLADTGSPAGMVGMGLAGFAALAGGGYVLMRLRRRQA